ncbi:hypothetical protein COU60_00680 [Candidatus Pacearchaeota archaeon CG10_big_fil_rev_8_21_14_0_10_34_76]|nr:MAG: hypothetical protein COU60_00680 [Candidatus Pacearchaeota archaeon CG10_big_fil_rev_8_21_14_0_10_34_76]
MVIELIQTYPRSSIVLISLIVSFFISLVNYLILDKDRLREIKRKQKELQIRMKEHKNNPTKQMELSKEMMSHTGEQLRHSFKPMLITFVPVIVAFWWIKDVFAETTIEGTWFWWYIISAIVFSLLLRKLFKLP